MDLMNMNKSDKILILVVFILIIVLSIIKLLCFKTGNYANVYYENKVIKRIDLRIDSTYTVNGYNGEVVIEVKDNKIRVKEEKSPLHICSRQGFVSDSTPIICLPNKIIIKIENKSNDLDAITN